jgi:hypothetical protein
MHAQSPAKWVRIVEQLKMSNTLVLVDLYLGMIDPAANAGHKGKGSITKRKLKYGKELCLLVEWSAKTRHEER